MELCDTPKHRTRIDLQRLRGTGVIRNKEVGKHAAPRKRTTITKLIVLAALVSATVVVAVRGGLFDEPVASSALFTNSTSNSSTFTVKSCPTSTAYRTAIVNTGANAHLRLNETGSTAFRDISGSRNWSNSSSGITRSQTGGLFCGSDAAIALSSGAIINSNRGNQVTGTTWSSAIWFAANPNAQGRLLGSSGNTSTALNNNSNSGDREIWITPVGTLAAGIKRSGQGYAVESADVVTDGDWHFAVLTQAADGIRLYLDGVQVGFTANTTTSNMSSQASWRIGFDQVSGYAGAQVPTTSLVGLVDEVAIWQSKTLSAAEVSQLWTASRN